MANVIKSVAWPISFLIISVIALILFKSNIEDLISRVTKTDIRLPKGIGITLEETVRSQTAQLDDLQSDIKRIVDVASVSQERAVTLAWGLIERRLRRIFAASHWNNGVYVDVKTNIQLLISLGVLTRNTLANLKPVEDERNRILAHREEGNKENTEVALVTAVQILNNLYSIPFQKNVVEMTGIKLYSDPRCEKEVSEVTGVMIKEIMIDGIRPRLDVFPTSRTDYRKGENVTWDSNMSRIWNALWYKDPNTGEIKKISSAEFVGGDLDAL